MTTLQTPAPISRRSLLAGGGALAMIGPRAAIASPELASAYPNILKFDVTREGSPLGTVMQRYRRAGNRLDVDVYIAFQVDLAFVTVYRYEHRAHEIWIDGRLLKLESITNDDGEDQRLLAKLGLDGMEVDGPSGSLRAPRDILPSSYWHPRFVEQSRMLDSQKGRILDFTIDKVAEEPVIALGRPVATERFAMRGDIDLDFWYDKDRVWRKMAFTIGGGFIEYTSVLPTADDDAKFGTPLSTGVTLSARATA